MTRKQRHQIQKPSDQTCARRELHLLTELRRIGYEIIPISAGLLIRKAA